MGVVGGGQVVPRQFLVLMFFSELLALVSVNVGVRLRG